MTLQEMATMVCSELGLYDTESLSLTKQFLDKEYGMLWDKYPWIDTDQFANVTVPAGSATVPLPTSLNRVISIFAQNLITGSSGTPDYRSDARFLDPVDYKFVIESSPNLLEVAGYVRYYEERRTSPGSPNAHLRFYPVPAVDTILTIQGKAICPGLVNPNDVSLIRNIDGALMAYAYFDMLQRQRQYGKADLKRKEAQELEAVAWNLEQQQANRPRMTKATTVAGNSLAELTDAVCMICGQWTPEYRLIIREFLRRNYQTLYDTFLWPESLVVVSVAYNSDQLILPHYIDRVLGVRSPGKFRMTPTDGVLLFDLNPSVFGETGEPLSYTTLTPVGVSVLPGVTTQLVFASTSNVDTSNIAIRGEITSTGAELEETVALQGTTPVMSQNSYDVPITVAKDITVGTITINAASDYRNLGQLRSYLREKRHQRLWLLPTLSDADNDGTKRVLVMGKRGITPLLSDQDTPIITGAQQVLIAAAAADLFRKLEKHDMANAMLQKAAGATDVLKAKNTDQAASSPRFVPQIEPRSYVAGCSW